MGKFRKDEFARAKGEFVEPQAPRGMVNEAKDEQKCDLRDSRLSGPKRLARREEEFIRKQMSKDALERCHDTKLAYVQCASGRSISTAFYCRAVFKEFNECLKQHTTAAEFEQRLAAARQPTAA